MYCMHKEQHVKRWVLASQQLVAGSKVQTPAHEGMLCVARFGSPHTAVCPQSTGCSQTPTLWWTSFYRGRTALHDFYGAGRLLLWPNWQDAQSIESTTTTPATIQEESWVRDLSGLGIPNRCTAMQQRWYSCTAAENRAHDSKPQPYLTPQPEPQP